MSTSKPDAVGPADIHRGNSTEGEPDGGTANHDGTPSHHAPARSHARTPPTSPTSPTSNGLANWKLRVARPDRACADRAALETHREWALELAGVPMTIAKEAFRLADAKLPFHCRFIQRDSSAA